MHCLNPEGATLFKYWFNHGGGSPISSEEKMFYSTTLPLCGNTMKKPLNGTRNVDFSSYKK